MESTRSISANALDQSYGHQFYREESMPLITFNNETQKFEVNAEVKPILDSLKGPIGVVAVAGQYRTGKSYLLNRMLLNRQKGFGVGPTINPCTKGLWIWGTPIQGLTPDGKPINILVVDSEGIGGLDEDNNHDMRIFSLAMLLSSYFLYNSVGSIDENALSNLSLVTNLTKHIQFKSQDSSSNEDQDKDDVESLIDYLPSFMWVVRDFALQLCDEDGNDINSKDYLERALQEKGSDMKNEIRKHLKKFFRERECCTMIRPLTNEDELQNLEKMELNELRAEFVEQIMHLRKKVLGKIKPKSIGNQSMDGSAWFQLVQQYVNAINEGCVPNIQSSWIYICKQKAQKILEECRNEFDKELIEQIQTPMNQEDLENILKQAATSTNLKFQQQTSSEAEVSSEYRVELEQYIQAKSQATVQQNHYECRQYAADLLNQLFSEFDQQIKSTQGPLNISQLDMTIKELTQVYDSNAIDFSDKAYLLAEAKASFLQDTLFYLTKKSEQDFELQKQIDSQYKERLEVQLKEAKDDLKTEKQKLEERLKQVILEKTESDASLQVIKEQLDNIKATKDQDEKDLKEQLFRMKSSYQSEVESLRSQKDEFEEKLQEIQRYLLQVESEFDKERALFDQKVEFLERSLEEKTIRERDFMVERQSQKQGISSEIKQLQAKYEQELKNVQIALEEEKERFTELECVLREKESQYQEKSELFTSQETQYKSMIAQSQDQTRQLELTLQALRRDSENKSNLNAREKDGKVEQFNSQIADLESQLKDTQEQLKNKEHEFKKERAIKDQKLEFLEMQLQDCKDQLEEAHKQHDQMVKAIKQDEASDYKSNKLSPSKLDSLQNELASKTEEYMIEIQDLKHYLEATQERLNDAELQLKLAQNDLERETKDILLQLTEAESLKTLYVDKVKALESQKSKITEEAERSLKLTVQDFEDEIEHKVTQHAQELKSMQEQSEEALSHLRSFYEIEKEKLEQRISEEREKGGRRMQLFQEELELRMRDDMQEKEEEIECLQNELRDSEQRHQGYVTQMEHELSLKHHLLETLERQVKESRDRMEHLEYGKNSAFEKQIENFEQQRQEYNAKIDRLQVENIEKDRLVAQLEHKLERMQDDVERKRSDIDSIQSSLDKERKQVIEKLESTKKKLSEAQDEAMKQKLDYGREQALLNQKVEFQQKKIDELQKLCDENQRFFDDKIKSFKADIQDEAQSQIERITSEKELWENKYEQKRRALKEIEMSLTKNNSDLEKKVITLSNQLERVEDDKRQMEDQFQDEIQQLNQQIQALDSSAGAAYYYGSAHAEDVLKYKSQMQELERDLSDLQSTYDRDKALWEGKCQFLETQKETYKRDLMESQKKFELTLEQLQKRGSMDKDKFENSQNSLMKVMEARYKSQIKELMETHQCFQQENQQKIKRLESEIKVKNEQIQLDARGKQSEYGSLEKKVIELSENEKRLVVELEEVKKERERRINDLQRQMEKDKDAYKQKLTEYEMKAKESESRRSALMFEFEKERAKWQLEKDNLNNIRSDLTEQVEKLQSRKDQLLRENEKLRNDNKGSRKYLFGNASNLPASGTSSLGQTQHHGGNSATRYMVGKSMSGAVGTSLGSAITKMKENHMQSKYSGSGSMGGGSIHEQDSSQHTTPNTKQYNRYGN